MPSEDGQDELNLAVSSADVDALFNAGNFSDSNFRIGGHAEGSPRLRRPDRDLEPRGPSSAMARPLRVHGHNATRTPAFDYRDLKQKLIGSKN